MSKRRNYEELEDSDVDPITDTSIRRMVAQADADVEAARVNFRWGQEQVSIVKRVANMMGVPYQTYIKQVVYRQALTDLQQAGSALGLQGSAPPFVNLQQPIERESSSRESSSRAT